MFGSGREEDRMVGYLSFLKIGPKLLRFLPGASSQHGRILMSAAGPKNPGLAVLCCAASLLLCCDTNALSE